MWFTMSSCCRTFGDCSVMAATPTVIVLFDEPDEPDDAAPELDEHEARIRAGAMTAARSRDRFNHVDDVKFGSFVTGWTADDRPPDRRPGRAPGAVDSTPATVQPYVLFE